jgi:hypothetical protein
LLNGKPATRFAAVEVNQESSNDKSIAEQAPSVDRGYTEITLQGDLPVSPLCQTFDALQ